MEKEKIIKDINQISKNEATINLKIKIQKTFNLLKRYKILKMMTILTYFHQ